MHTAPRVFNLGDRCSSVPLISLGKPLVPSTQGPCTSDVDDENICPRPVSNSGRPACWLLRQQHRPFTTGCHTNRCPWKKADYTEILQRGRTAFKEILESKFTFGHGHTFEQNMERHVNIKRPATKSNPYGYTQNCMIYVGWGAALQAGRLRVRFPMKSVKFFNKTQYFSHTQLKSIYLLLKRHVSARPWAIIRPSCKPKTETRFVTAKTRILPYARSIKTNV
jgi:hypothetical protein